ncbi:MAG: lipopolysaccharide heptosyltransferase II [Vicinamibacterales bacterium]
MKRLVVRLPNWLGDIVMALPALGALRRQWSDWHCSVALPRAYAPLMDAVTGVDGVVPLQAKPWRDRAARLDDVASLRDGRFHRGVLFTNSYASARLLREAGIPERIGYATDWRGRLLTERVPRRARRGDARHQARYFGLLAEALGARVESYAVALEAPQEWLDRADALLAAAGVPVKAELVGFAPGAAYGTAKQWPPERVARLVDLVSARGLTALLLGAPADGPTGEAVTQALAAPASAHCVNLIGQTDLLTLAGLMSRCAALVSNDSGSMHLASALGVKTVAVFGPTDEHATSPLGPHTIVPGQAWCRPCLRRVCPLDHRCMTSVAPEQVMAVLQRQLTADS